MTKHEAGAAARRVWVICEGKHEQDGSLETLIQRQPEPEKTREPKAAIKSLYGDAKGDQGLAAFYTELAKHVDLEALRQRCPNGFAPWAERVTSLQFPPS